jgi:hypothetical protein
VNDCDDNSDETDCDMVDLPQSYSKDHAPEPVKENTDLQLFISLDVSNVDSVDTINMIVTLTIQICIKWHDGRLRFFNAIRDLDNVVDDAKAKLMWLPLNHLIIENAILGDIVYDEHRKVQVHPNISQPNGPQLAYENRVYNGSYNLLSSSRRMKIKYNCKFDLYNFPFDKKKCFLIFKIRQYRNINVTFVQDGPIVYNGPDILNEFSIGRMSGDVNTTYENAVFTLAMPLSRVFNHQVLKTFIPTFILWLLAYSTIYIDIEESESRLGTTVTMMLVEATWMSLISGDLPKTAYVKLIDCWFLWHIVITFTIIIFHIFLERMRKQQNKRTKKHDVITINQKILYHPRKNSHVTENKGSTNRVVLINRNAAIIFSIINCLFYGVYFYLTFQ